MAKNGHFSPNSSCGLPGGQMCAHLYYICLVEHSTRNWGSSPLLILIHGEGAKIVIFIEYSILRGTPPAFYTTCILSELGNALNRCHFNSSFIAFYSCHIHCSKSHARTAHSLLQWQASRVSNPGFTEPENPGNPEIFQTRKTGFGQPANPGFRV